MRTVQDHIVVVGAGSAGLLSALTLRRAFPALKVTIVHDPNVPVIGVGESTTAILPPFLHSSLGIEFQDFFRNVGASWKLGIRFDWGDPEVPYFNYTFDSCMSTPSRRLRKMPAYYCLRDWTDASRGWALMDRNLSPCMRKPNGDIEMSEAFGYHIDNRAFIRFLTQRAKQLNVRFVEGQVVGVRQDENGYCLGLELQQGTFEQACLVVDCSGFRSELLRGVLEEPFVDYRKSLFCDRAVVAQWPRTDAIRPYTTTETMDHGWSWRIDFPKHISRGYVYASSFCNDNDAIREFLSINPEADEDNVRVVSFDSGRYRRFWVKNIVALGNASGFVEPLEATALHLLVEQVRLVCRLLSETDGRLIPGMEELANHRYRILWDEVRDFLAVHYAFNRKRNTPFWQHCREETDLAGAREFVDLFRRFGPSTLCTNALEGGHLFGYDGFMSMLIGQRVGTSYVPQFDDEDLRAWQTHQQQIRNAIARAIPMESALERILH